MVGVLHLSHTDIRCDSRILKEMTALADASADYKVAGIGIGMHEDSAVSSQASSLDICSLNLLSRKLTQMPKVLRHSLTLFELMAKSFFKAIRLRPRIIHCHDTLVLPMGVVLKTLTKAKLIYDAHELESDRNGLSRMLSRWTFRTEKMAWPFVDVLITVSPSINQWYQDNIGVKASVLILNSPDSDVQGAEESGSHGNYLRERYDIPKDSKIFIYVGILARGRGLEKVLDVFSGNRKSHLVIMGYGELSLMIHDKTRANKNIHFHEAVPHEKVVPITQCADVGVCLVENVSLSDYYCLPNKLFEYVFAGIPVLASDFPDIRNVVGTYGLGICCDLNLDSIRAAIEQYEGHGLAFTIDPSRLHDLAWETQKSKLLAAYANLIANPS